MPEEKVRAYVLLTVEIGREYDLVEEIKKLDKDATIDADVVYGEYDVVVRIEASNLKAIDKIVTKIRSMEGVLKTVTLIAS